MEAKLIKIGNSSFIIIPDRLIEQFRLSNTVAIEPAKNGILIKRKARAGWEDQLKRAILEEGPPDDELLERFNDNFDEVF